MTRANLSELREQINREFDAWTWIGDLWGRFTIEARAGQVRTRSAIAGRFLGYLYGRIDEEGRRASGLVPSPIDEGVNHAAEPEV